MTSELRKLHLRELSILRIIELHERTLKEIQDRINELESVDERD